MEDLAQNLIDGVRGGSGDGDTARRVQGVRQRTVNRRLTDLSSEHLRRIELRLEDQAAHIAQTLEDMEAKGNAALADNDWQRYDLIRLEVIEAVRDFEELQELRGRVTDARLERALSEAIAARLGSERRRRAYDLGIIGLIILVVGLLLYELFNEVPDDVRAVLDIIDIGACALFLADFTWRHRLAESKGWFWKRYWIDFVTSIPLPSVQSLRLGRTVRLVRLVRMLRFVRLLRIFRVVLFFWRGMDKLAAAFDIRLMRRSINILTAILLIGGLGIWLLEGRPQYEGVADFGESVWWSFTTVVTGGFGDIHNPVSLWGRVLTAALVIAGMVVVGIFTATLTSLLVRENDASGAILALEDRMLEQLEEVRRHMGLVAETQSALLDARATRRDPD
ncbi:MAG: ion transporter [Myxococcales bacterium]|nr:ion transporter [Myxococcales bacterium]